MKIIAGRIWKDIKDHKYAFAILAVYAGITDAYFARFCPQLILLGVPCPACGITRAFKLTLQFRLAEAFSMHVFIYAVYVFAFLFIYHRYITGNDMKKLRGWMTGTLSFAIIYYIWRMIRYFPNQNPMVFWWDSILGRILQQLN